MNSISQDLPGSKLRLADSSSVASELDRKDGAVEPRKSLRSGILVVDDTVETLQVLVATLVAEGHQVRPASAGQQALDAIEARLPELVLLDVRMPGMDGFEVCRRLQEREETRPIPILFLSSSTDPQERIRGLAMGAVDFIPKPFQREELLARVRTHLELSRLRQRLEADVAERTHSLEQALTALRESEERYRLIVENAPIGIYRRSLDGHFDYANPGFLRQFAFEYSSNLFVEPIDIRKMWSCPEKYEEHLAQLRETGAVHGKEACFRLADGTEKWLSLYGIYEPECDRVTGFSVDITEQKRSSAERDQLQLQLQRTRKLESIGTLAGGIAHDFNNILTVILFNAELGMAACEESNPLWSRFSEILGAGRRSAALTKQLLAFARSQPVAPVRLDVNSRIADALSLLRRLIGESIRLDWSPGSDLGSISIDPSQIDQILANLCVNARDAIQGEGTVRIATTMLDLSASEILPHPEARSERYVRIEVQDTGSGIPAEVLDKIFDPFFTTKELGKGTGLGLSTLYGIVVQNRGFVDVESAPGAGTTFRIHLPCRCCAEDEAEPLSCGGASISRTETILLVVDSAPLRQVVTGALTGCGFNVLSATNSREALRLGHLHEGAIHLLLTDVVMPEMNGKELARRLVEWRPYMQVLFLSGSSSEVAADEEAKGGAKPFLVKPFQVETLVNKVVEMLEGR